MTAKTIDVQKCRQLLEADDEALSQEFDPRSVYNIGSDNNIERKLNMVKDGVLQLCIDIVRKSSDKHRYLRKDIWNMISELVVPNNVDDEKEAIPIKEFVKLGGVELAADEFKRRFHSSGDKSMLLTFAWLATVDEATPPIVECGIHKYAIEIISKSRQENPDTFDTALAFIRTASGCYSVRQKLRDDGALKAAISLLDNLNRPEADQLALRTGFRAGSVVARLAGNDEQGEGVQVLRGNPLLIRRTTEILDKVLDAGPGGTVLNMMINPHFITMDLLTIATSDANKPLLKDSIPVLVKALKLRGLTNEQMVVDLLNIFLQLSFDKDCLPILQQQAQTLLQSFDAAFGANPSSFETDAKLSLVNLMNALQPSAAPSAPTALGGLQYLEEAEEVVPKDVSKARGGGGGGLKLGGLIRRAMKDKPQAATAERKKSVSDAAPKHIMLSYNWGVKPIVQKVDELLRANGVKTWLDEYVIAVAGC